MDIIHHTAIGSVAMMALTTAGHEVAGAAFLAGSIAPDLDVVFMLGGKRFYLKNHQGPSHSLFLAPIFAWLIALPLFSITQTPSLVYVMALSGILLHLFLDWSNTFGIGLLWPVWKTRFCREALFFIDLTFWCLTLTFAGLIYFYSIQFIGVVYFILLFSYVAFRVILHRRVCSNLGCSHAIPSSLNPFIFFISDKTSCGVSTYLYHALKRQKWDSQFYPAPSAKMESLAKSSQVYRDMQGITKLLSITEVVEDDSGVVITAVDFAVRNYGGRFGRTVLHFDSAGQLLDEKANI